MMILMSGEPRCLTSDVQHLKVHSIRLKYLLFLQDGRSGLIYTSGGICRLINANIVVTLDKSISFKSFAY
jgi:hypothetical protein